MKSLIKQSVCSKAKYEEGLFKYRVIPLKGRGKYSRTLILFTFDDPTSNGQDYRNRKFESPAQWNVDMEIVELGDILLPEDDDISEEELRISLCALGVPVSCGSGSGGDIRS